MLHLPQSGITKILAKLAKEKEKGKKWEKDATITKKLIH
jgi:hypothetical protein